MKTYRKLKLYSVATIILAGILLDALRNHAQARPAPSAARDAA